MRAVYLYRKFGHSIAVVLYLFLKLYYTIYFFYIILLFFRFSARDKKMLHLLFGFHRVSFNSLALCCYSHIHSWKKKKFFSSIYEVWSRLSSHRQCFLFSFFDQFLFLNFSNKNVSPKRMLFKNIVQTICLCERTSHYIFLIYLY